MIILGSLLSGRAGMRLRGRSRGPICDDAADIANRCARRHRRDVDRRVPIWFISMVNRLAPRRRRRTAWPIKIE